MYYFLYVLLLVSIVIQASDTGRSSSLGAGQSSLPLTVTQQRAVPIAIYQKSENYVDFVAKNGEKLRFKVKLVVNVKPHDDTAEVTMEIFQGGRLIAARNLDLFW